jgi:hypothetical protein
LIWRKFLRILCTQDKKVDNQGYNNTIDKKTRQHEIGTKITKYWNGIPYKGTVTNNNGKYYKIQYEDNDEEELNHGEVKKYNEKNRREGRTTREIGTRMRLRKPLGEWRILANKSERLWPFYYSHNTDTLYRSYREEWHQNGKFYYDWHTMTDNDTYDYVQSGNVSLLSVDASPADVMDTKDGRRISTHLPMMPRNTHRRTPATFMEYLMAQEAHITQYYTQIDFLTTPVTIYKLLKSTNKVNIATDGGAIPLKGSLGFVFVDEEGTILWTCYGQSSGNNPLSFRSEICAFLAAVRLVTLLNKYYDEILQCEEPARSKIQVYTDRYISNKGVQWMHKFCIKKLPTGERVHKRDHFHDKRCATCWHTLEDDNHIFQCAKRRSLRKRIINQINLMRNRIDPRLCDILQEGLLTYFKGDSVTNAMLRIRGQEGYEIYDLLIGKQTVIGWANLLTGFVL